MLQSKNKKQKKKETSHTRLSIWPSLSRIFKDSMGILLWHRSCARTNGQSLLTTTVQSYLVWCIHTNS